VKLKQRQNHEKLAMGKSIPLLPDCKYYLVPSSWLSNWKDYINASGKNASSYEKPETLDGVIDLLKCEKVTLCFACHGTYLIIFWHLWWRVVSAYYAFDSLDHCL
jgi:hypothetical protein